MLFERLVRAVVEFHIPAHVIEARQQFPAHTFLHLLKFLIREHAAESRLDRYIYIGKYRYRVMLKKNPDAFLPLRSNWFHILLCLVEGEQHGYGIMQNVLARSDGKVRLWPATLYGSLRRLIEAGLIVESGDRPAPEFDDARRRYYKLTTLGRRVLDLESQRLKDLVRILDARRRQEART
jgi:DNA-binding PadR family transcriptional regulator